MNPLSWSFRTSFALCAALCAAFLGYAFYTQFQGGLEPCPLCILQRVAFMALFAVALLAALHNPNGKRGRRVYGALALLSAGFGLLMAGRHVWLQHLPADKVPDCGPGLAYMLDSFPLSKTIKMIFTGSGECAKVDWTFVGLSMPEWTLVWFVLFSFGAYWYGLRQPRQ
jgi:disulfide bond formation protein DsbB